MPEDKPTNATLNLGLLDTPPDDRDKPFAFGAAVPQIGISEVPNTDWDYSGLTLIKNQQNSDYCGGYSSAAVGEDKEKIEMCPVFQFAAAKWIQGDVSSYGTDLRSIGQGHRKIGELPKSECPHCKLEGYFDDKWRDLNAWPKESLEIAEVYKKKTMVWVDRGKYDVFDNIRTALWQFRGEGKSIETGVGWRASWLNAQGGVIPEDDSSVIGGHAIKIMLRQKMINGEPHLVIQNSYGPDVGDGGLFYFPRNVVNRDFLYGAFNMPDLDAEVIKANYIPTSLPPPPVPSLFQRFLNVFRRFFNN